jgi:hypothetical protein
VTYQEVIVSATVTGAGATPTGAVGVSINGVPSACTIKLLEGSGSCSVVFNTKGIYTITAVYSGDSNYGGSSDFEIHTVSMFLTTSSTTVITADDPDPSSAGQPVAVSVTVSGTGSTPTGTVAITGADTNCTLTLASGSGSCNVVFNTAGDKTLMATYGGDASYASSSDTEKHNVSQGQAFNSTTVITADNPDPSIPGQPVAVSVTVSGTGSTPTGIVAITGADTNCSITLVNGSGSCYVVFNTIGAKILTATYSGDGNYTPSADTESHTVKNGTTTTITSDQPDPSLVGQPVTIQFSVAATVPGNGTPTGDVMVSDGTHSCTGSVAAGSCSITFTTLGLKHLTATYVGDADFNGSFSTPPTAHMVIPGNITFTALVCLALYLILIIVGIILVILVRRHRRKGKKDHCPIHR